MLPHPAHMDGVLALLEDAESEDRDASDGDMDVDEMEPSQVAACSEIFECLQRWVNLLSVFSSPQDVSDAAVCTRGGFLRFLKQQDSSFRIYHPDTYHRRKVYRELHSQAECRFRRVIRCATALVSCCALRFFVLLRFLIVVVIQVLKNSRFCFW